MTARTQDEILARFQAIEEYDFLGFRSEVLAEAMTAETLRPLADPDANLSDHKPIDAEAVAREYMVFAVGKIVDHRGISASRSVEKLTEYAWLMGRDDVIAAMEAVEYEQYGAPQVRAFAETLGWPWPGEVANDELKMLDRMANGLPCRPDCEDGCGL